MSGRSRMQVAVGALVLAASVTLAPSAGWSQPASPPHFGHRAYLFSSGPGPQGGINWDLSPALRVVERFTRVGPRTLDYQFTVEDPNVWTRPWTGSSPWALSDQPMFEYACHEGNYGLTNILAGSRAEEARDAER